MNLNLSSITLSNLLFFLFLQSFCQDKITLIDSSTFEGKVTKIQKSQVCIKTGQSRHLIQLSDILEIKLENKNDRLLSKYFESGKEDNYKEGDKCLKGKLDAKSYHGKKGAHFVYGLLGEFYVVLGAASSKPTPITGKRTLKESHYKELFSDPEYLKCYTRRARGQNVKYAALGAVTGFSILLYIFSTSF